MLEQKPVAVGLGNIVKLDDLVSQTRSVRDVDLKISLLLASVLGGKLLVCAQTGLGLGVAGFRSHPHPFELTFESLAALALLLFLHRETTALLVEPR